MKKIFLGIAGSLLLIGASTGAYFIGKDVSKQTPTISSSTQSVVASPPDNTSAQTVATHQQTQEEMIVYLLEEEKLAHDIYTVMYERYGAKVFGNILNSESTHQSKVMALLETRNITDPRSSELGVFTNQELQQLYNTLKSQGLTCAEEAYKVGVIIEEKDIADITKQLASATDNDILTALESLRTGSENHLRAFNRQIGKY